MEQRKYLVDGEWLKEVLIKASIYEALEAGGVDNWSGYDFSIHTTLDELGYETVEETVEKEILPFLEVDCGIGNKTLDSSAETKEYLNTLPKIYLKVRWVEYGILDFPFSGFYKDLKGKAVPLVWNFNDYNGAYEEYVLEPITFTTTAEQVGWTFDKKEADEWFKTRTNNFN